MTGGTITHPSYAGWDSDVLIGDTVAVSSLAGGDPAAPVGTVTAIYLESVELSTGDQVPVADLVLLRRADA